MTWRVCCICWLAFLAGACSGAGSRIERQCPTEVARGISGLDGILFDGRPARNLIDILLGAKEPWQRAEAAGNLYYVYLGYRNQMMFSGADPIMLALSIGADARAGCIMPAMICALGDKSAQVRLAVIDTIKEMALHASQSRDSLMWCANHDPNMEVRHAAQRALERVVYFSRL